MAAVDERPSAKRWLPLEANPDIMNQVLFYFSSLFFFFFWFSRLVYRSSAVCSLKKRIEMNFCIIVINRITISKSFFYLVFWFSFLFFFFNLKFDRFWKLFERHPFCLQRKMKESIYWTAYLWLWVVAFITLKQNGHIEGYSVCEEYS